MSKLGCLITIGVAFATAMILDASDCNGQYPNFTILGHDSSTPCQRANCWCNHQRHDRRQTTVTTDPKIEIMVNGKVIAERSAGESDRSPTDVVFGSYGTNYEIRISNPSINNRGFQAQGSRRMFDIEVDGLSAMDGKPRSERKRGYILSADESSTIQGWRINDNQVKQFVVSKPGQSVAASEGTESQTGKIIVRVFRERATLNSNWNWGDYAPRTTSPWTWKRGNSGTWGSSGTGSFGAGFQGGSQRRAAPSSGSAQSQASFGISGAAGTAAGSSVDSKVRRVSFEPDTWRVSTIEFTYRVNR
ncbi:hypothetical protein Pla52o_15650 [Novipirellula galeiformis]|uniref:Uncharacterized protein n=1 Tax=Novipirellula galeiformis TaxID=2528004 RepID=A0A5C6CNT2_9BACT|nr:hypothetical protein [Novipirellula galeiformis]TWU25267.1 hypothetical protein Pla52o_15650 [Novipirellula galeiformis]